MQDVDIAIIGGGVAGMSLASFLGSEKRIALLEQEDAPGYHSTGRSAAEFVLSYNPPEICRLARLAKPFFDHPPAGFAEVPLLTQRGGLVIADVEKVDQLREQFDALSPLVPGLLWLTPEEAIERVPFLAREAVAGAYFDPQYWDIDADALMQGYQRRARNTGTSIHLKCGLVAAQREEEWWLIQTESGTFRAKTIVNAAGAWADTVAAICGVRPLSITPLRRTAILADLPEGADASRLPEINEISDSFYFKPEGGRLLVSPADETPCEPSDVQPEEIDIAWAVHHLESATSIRVKRVDTSWAGLRSFSPDRLPVVGFAGDQPGFFWLAGQGGFGILTSPALGELAACLITGKPLPERFIAEGLDPEVFSPSRFAA